MTIVTEFILRHILVFFPILLSYGFTELETFRGSYSAFIHFASKHLKVWVIFYSSKRQTLHGDLPCPDLGDVCAVSTDCGIDLRTIENRWIKTISRRNWAYI